MPVYLRYIDGQSGWGEDMRGGGVVDKRMSGKMAVWLYGCMAEGTRLSESKDFDVPANRYGDDVEAILIPED